jgi:hypothetical protein
MEIIFQEGHDIHDKWQGWIWDIGRLHGAFECMSCKEYWFACSPKKCHRCGVGRAFLRYREVPVSSEEHGIIGHADADLGDDLVEIKSIGVGTLRWDAPETLKRFQRKGITDAGFDYNTLDWPALWKSIRRPFLSHRVQASLYAELLERRWIVFIYESKYNQLPKEFVIKHDPELVAPILAKCKSVKAALEGGRKPRCIKPGECAQCARYENGSENGTNQRKNNGKRPSRTAASGERTLAPRAARRRYSEAVGAERSRDGRRGSDRPVHAPNSLGGLSQRAFGPGGDR